MQSNRENKESKDQELLLTSTLRQYFSELNLQKIKASAATSPLKFLDDPDGRKAIQFQIASLTKLIREEIEDLCSRHNPSELIDEFVDIMVSTQFPVKTIKAGEFFYRARLGRKEIQGAVDDCNTTFILPYYGKDIGKPPALRTHGGRFNRAGQSFLYLSSDVETAIAEVHLQVGQECSVGKFKATKDIELIDLSVASSTFVSSDAPSTPISSNEGSVKESGQDVEQNSLIIKFWRDFLLQPVYSDTTHRYLLTQFITDAILKAKVPEGLSGIFFNSIQAKGDNIVCFEDDMFELVPFSEQIYRADKIDYKIAEVEDGVRKWCRSPDYRSISGLNLDEEEKKEKEIEYLNDWIENERGKQGIPDVMTQRREMLKKMMEQQRIMPNRLDRGFFMYQEEFERKALSVLRSGWYILGNEVKSFEEEFAAYTGAKYCVGLASGLDALWIAFRLLKIGTGDEVIVQGNTYIASVMGITMNGATPVFVEPDEHFGMDPSKIEELITDKTKAVLVTHLYGMASRMDEIVSICKEHNLRLVEDCAQSHGACFNGKMTGTFGDIGCFSFYPSKNLGAFGDAGAIVTDNEQLAQVFRVFRNYGSEKRYYNKVVGANSRLDELQAGLLRVRLTHMEELTEEKQKIATRYNEGIKNPLIKLPVVAPGATSVWHQYVIRCGSWEDRDRLIKYLDEKGIGTIIHYPIPPHLAEAYQYLGHKEGFLPITEHLAKTVLSIPMYNGMTDYEQERVIEALNGFKGSDGEANNSDDSNDADNDTNDFNNYPGEIK